MLLAALTIRLLRPYQSLLFDPGTGTPSFLAITLSVVFSLNLLLGTFNLLPVPPLDGSTGVMILMSETRAQRYLDWIRGNNYALAGLFIGMALFWRIYPLVETLARKILF
jgi:Zn-dependent protease